MTPLPLKRTVPRQQRLQASREKKKEAPPLLSIKRSSAMHRHEAEEDEGEDSDPNPRGRQTLTCYSRFRTRNAVVLRERVLGGYIELCHPGNLTRNKNYHSIKYLLKNKIRQ